MKDSKWFPGHMKNALEDIEENKIKLVEININLCYNRANAMERKCLESHFPKMT